MIKSEVQAMIIFFAVLSMSLVYVAYQVNNLQMQIRDLQKTTGTIIEALCTHVSELENLIVKCGVTIDNGTATITETVYLTKGATALEALRRVAVVETTYYSGLGEFVNKINGVGGDPGKYWAFFYWGENDWVYSEIGPGSYKVRDVDNIKFWYTSW